MKLDYMLELKGNKEARGVYGELRFAQGGIEIYNGAGELIVFIGRNSIVDKLILDTIKTEKGVVTIGARDVEGKEHIYTFELKEGNIKGTKKFTEEYRKGKVPVDILDANRKKVYKRLKNGIKMYA